MFSQRITNSARFLKMSHSAQNLYFHFGLRADDDGVVEAFPIMQMLGSAEDDFKILVAKGFVVPLNDDLVAFITDWNEHNLIRADRKVNSIYKDLLLRIVPEAELVEPKPRADTGVPTGKKQTTGRPLDANWTAQGRLGKGRLGQDSKEGEEEKPVAVPATPSPADEMRAFVSEESKQNEIMALLVSKGLPEAIAEREVRKFLGYWTELNKTGKKQRWELQKTFELRRRLTTWFNNIAERQQGSQRPRGINLND